MKNALLASALCASAITLAHPAYAKAGDPVKIGSGVTFDPIIDARLRYENVDTPTLDASAVTMRLRAGAELKHESGLSFLVETEGTVAIDTNYNAFPFVIADTQRRVGHAVVPDPMNVELNRIQLQYKSKAFTLTLGRQRINLDDQRFVGSVGWRQNEQTFDAVRAEVTLGPVSFDGTYSNSQRTIFGIDAGQRQAYDGKFIFLGAGAKLGPVAVKGFAYLLGYNESFFFANSSQTYGARATTSLPLAPKVKLNLAASYARQSDWRTNPGNYQASYIAAEAGLAVRDLILTAGYEKLGSDNGRSVQTPMATLHKFNGWADVFLTTPVNGLQDYYGGVAYKFTGVKALPGLNAAVVYHRFDSAVRSARYGNEWNASLGFKLGPVALLAKYADYNARRFGADTRKIWLQADISY